VSAPGPPVARRVECIRDKHCSNVNYAFSAGGDGGRKSPELNRTRILGWVLGPKIKCACFAPSLASARL
jgi:hypothetical protein